MDTKKIVELYMKALGKSKLSEEVWKKIAKVNQKVLDIETGKISDGYHTFDELYEHRITLFIALCRTQHKIINQLVENGLEIPFKIWCSKLHAVGTMFDGWFILGIKEKQGEQITYHLPDKYWNEVRQFAESLNKAPKFDGHTPENVLERLKKL